MLQGFATFFIFQAGVVTSPPRAQDFRHAPGLRKCAAREVRRVAIENLADGAQPGRRKMVGHGFEKREGLLRIAGKRAGGPGQKGRAARTTRSPGGKRRRAPTAGLRSGRSNSRSAASRLRNPCGVTRRSAQISTTVFSDPRPAGFREARRQKSDLGAANYRFPPGRRLHQSSIGAPRFQ